MLDLAQLRIDPQINITYFANMWYHHRGIPALKGKDALNTIEFIHDGAPPHTAWQVTMCLRNTFA
jgi:hypothetical protein